MSRGENSRKRKYQILAILCSAVFLSGGIWLTVSLIGLRQTEREFQSIRESYVAPTEESLAESGGTAKSYEAESTVETNETPEETDMSIYGLDKESVDIAALQKEVNPDIYAWISVPGTAIDYPVVQHPEEMDYYLEYNLDGTKGRPGGIYTQRMNAKDWTDPNTVIYGHNMRNGTMFATLHKFEDSSFFEENRYIHIYTEDGKILVYEVFAAYVTDNRHQLMIWNLDTEDGFEGYLAAIGEHTGKSDHILKDREVTAEDRILTLSTCTADQADKRYLVQGVLVAEGRQP